MKNLLSEFHRRTNLTAPLFSNLGSETKLYTQNFEIQVSKGTPIAKGFEILSKNSFHGSKTVLSGSEGGF
jgi:hypothetical protein